MIRAQTYWESDCIEAVFHDPFPVRVTNPRIPLSFKHLLGICGVSNLVLGSREA